MVRTMLGSLIMHEKIETTEAKAKEIKTRADRIINIAKKTRDGSKKISAIRQLDLKIPKMAVKKLTGEFIARFESRNSGYVKIIKIYVCDF